MPPCVCLPITRFTVGLCPEASQPPFPVSLLVNTVRSVSQCLPFPVSLFNLTFLSKPDFIDRCEQKRQHSVRNTDIPLREETPVKQGGNEQKVVGKEVKTGVKQAILIRFIRVLAGLGLFCLRVENLLDLLV